MGVLTGATCAHGQDSFVPDSLTTTTNSANSTIVIKNWVTQAVNSVKRQPPCAMATSVESKSEDAFMNYDGRIIRKIDVVTLNFDQSIEDPDRRDNSWEANLGKQMHTTTKAWVVRHNLFFKENAPINAYKLSDNERHLRTLDFIHDARIFVMPILGTNDSVDILVVTRDLFSIAGGAASEGTNHITTNLYETNLGGMGQRLELNTLYDHNRNENWGYGILYRKNNLMGSFIDATLSHSTMSINPYTHQEETNTTLSFNRKLISPYSHFAGGLTISNNESFNRYNREGSKFFNYHYTLFDVWSGYNLGIKKLTATNNGIRDRRFLALRYYNRNFTEVPDMIGKNYNPIYNSSQAILGQFTFFRQDYYKTHYLYGFGTTEDIPNGYNISVTGGWHKQLSLERVYLGTNISNYTVGPYGCFMQLYGRAGGFLHNGGLQDAAIMVGMSAYSPVFKHKNVRIRQYAAVSLAHQWNRTTTEWLDIANNYGPRGFISDSAYGAGRFTLQLETSFFLPGKIAGFSFAPFPFADVSMLTQANKNFKSAVIYSSFGGGVRARNENLIFETIEARAYYFPIAPDNMKGFKVILSTNVRFRYSSNYVTAPDIVKLNGD